MSANPYDESKLSTSSLDIPRARAFLKRMSKQERIDLMVEAVVMTKKQAERAKKKLAETGA